MRSHGFGCSTAKFHTVEIFLVGDRLLSHSWLRLLHVSHQVFRVLAAVSVLLHTEEWMLQHYNKNYSVVMIHQQHLFQEVHKVLQLVLLSLLSKIQHLEQATEVSAGLRILLDHDNPLTE